MKLRPLTKSRLENITEKLVLDLEYLITENKREHIISRLTEAYYQGLKDAVDDICDDLANKRKILRSL